MFLRTLLFVLLFFAVAAGCASLYDSSQGNTLSQSRVEILSPLPNTDIDDSAVEISFRFLKGRKDGGEHVHLYLDGEKWGIAKRSPVRLNRLAPGPHTVFLEIVTIDHVPVAGVGTEVRFRVRQPLP